MLNPKVILYTQLSDIFILSDSSFIKPLKAFELICQAWAGTVFSRIYLVDAD